MRNRILGALAAAMLALAALTGCSVSASIGGKTISQSDLETETKNALQPKFNVELTQAQCRGGLKVETGATQECVIEGGGQWQLVTVTATDDDGNFNVNAIPGVVPKPDWAR